MNQPRTLSILAIAFGLVLTVGMTATAQVVEGRPAAATLTQEPQAQAGEGLAVVRRVSEILSGEAQGPGDEGRTAAISDLIMDGQGRPHYILLSRGGVAGVGGEKIAVPFGVGSLNYVEDGGWQLELNMTGDQLDQAPTLEEGSLDQLRDQSWIQSNRQFFQSEQAGGQAGTADDTFLFRASALRGAQVRGTGGEESIANVDDVLLGAEMNASHAILGYGGVAGLGKDQVPVPFNMLQLGAETENDRYVLVVSIDTTKERLQSDAAPKLDGEYNRMLDPTFIERVDTYFNDTTGAVESPTGAVEPLPRP